MFSIIWRIRDVIYCSLRGLPPAFVFLIPAILLKYSGPRLAVFMPPLCPNRAAGGLAIRCSMTLIAASRSSCTRLDRPCGSSAGEVVSTVSASVMRFRNAWTSVLSDGFFGITLTVAGRRIRKQPLAVLFARPQGHYRGAARWGASEETLRPRALRVAGLPGISRAYRPPNGLKRNYDD
jgi:hypothetical protein